MWSFELVMGLFLLSYLLFTSYGFKLLAKYKLRVGSVGPIESDFL